MIRLISQVAASATPADAPTLPPASALPVRGRGGAAMLLATALGCGLIAAFLRAFELGRSFDIFIDEITYFRLSQSVAWQLHVTLYDKPFFLHPPAFFFAEAAFLKIVHPVNHPLIDKILIVRYVNVGFSAVSAAALYLLGHRVGHRLSGLVISLTFALDPFVITMNSQNLLDTAAVCWMLLGYVSLLVGVKGVPLAVSPLRAVLAGVFFGLALLTKDMTAFLSVLPMMICLITGWCFSRRVPAIVLSTVIITYLPYPIIAATSGHWAAFQREKTHGLARLAGFIQETGFNRSGSPSLLHTIIVRLTQYGTTYTIIALGVVGTLILWRQREPATRLVAVWSASAYALLAYCVAIGTLEEQFFYLLVVPALVSTVVGILVLVSSESIGTLSRLGLTAAATILGLAFVCWIGYRWYEMHTIPNDGYRRLLAYIGRTVPYRDRHIAAPDQTAQFLLGKYASGPFGAWSSVSALRRYSPNYVIITPHEMDWDYGVRGLRLQAWTRQHGTLVFAFHGQLDNNIALYRLHLGPPDARSRKS